MVQLKNETLSFTPSNKLQKAYKSTQSDLIHFAGELDEVSEEEYNWLH